MKSINSMCCQEIPSALLAQNMAKFNDIDTCKTIPLIQAFFFNWNSPHARLNSHYEAWSYKKKKKHKKYYRIQKICLQRTYN